MSTIDRRTFSCMRSCLSVQFGAPTLQLLTATSVRHGSTCHFGSLWLPSTAIHSLPMKRFQKIAVAYGADLSAFELNGEVVSGLPGHHSSENLVLSWARRDVGDDCLEMHVLLMFF